MPNSPHINARAETARKLLLFREAFVRRSSLVPPADFSEWQQRADGKQPCRFERRYRRLRATRE